jgi:hypothetical protein
MGQGDEMSQDETQAIGSESSARLGGAESENNLIIKLQFAESVVRDQDKAIKEMVEAYGEMEKGIEDPILCHYNGLRLHNAMEDLRALVTPGYKPNYEPNTEPELDGSSKENLNPSLK